MARFVASVTVLALVAGLTGCAVAPGYDYAYAQPYYYPGYYGYGYPYAPVYGSIGIWGGWGGSCCYYHGHGGGYWHGGNGWRGANGWHGGGSGGGWHGSGYGGSQGGSSWSSGGGHSGRGR
ncbi:hypothetical protein [Paraburkholderia fungorum]|uniref:hypothetical protein n=1 Tax=Paraburkholderia fungorum TaxID=134537 RepID=UPI0038B9715B